MDRTVGEYYEQGVGEIMFKRNKNRSPDAKREAILEAIRKASINGYCILLGEMPDGTRVIIIGRDALTSQLEEIAKTKGVEL